MRKCSHELAWRAIRVKFAPGVKSPYIERHRYTGEQIRNVLVDAKRCADCSAWLPLGPSNDEPEAVKVEMRAAEIAVPFPHRTIGRFTDERQYEGWWLHPSAAEHWGNEEWAGYLAACITTHDPRGEK